MTRRLAFLALVAALLFSSTATAEQAKTRRLSHPLWITGVVMVVAGSVSWGIGVPFAGASTAMSCGDRCYVSDDKRLGRVLFVYGMTGTLVGTAAIIIGTRSVPVRKSSIPSWSVGPGSGSLRWSF